MEITELVGKKLTHVLGVVEGDRITFITDTGDQYAMIHEQDCCESVYIDDIDGDLDDLLNTPILEAEERTSDTPAKDSYDDSYTWTFYVIRTIKGTVTIKWYGSSNGYYSESVDFVKL